MADILDGNFESETTFTFPLLTLHPQRFRLCVGSAQGTLFLPTKLNSYC